MWGENYILTYFRNDENVDTIMCGNILPNVSASKETGLCPKTATFWLLIWQTIFSPVLAELICLDSSQWQGICRLTLKVSLSSFFNGYFPNDKMLLVSEKTSLRKSTQKQKNLCVHEIQKRKLNTNIRSYCGHQSKVLQISLSCHVVQITIEGYNTVGRVWQTTKQILVMPCSRSSECTNDAFYLLV